MSYDAGDELFSADVTVRNLLTQPLGTSDGETVDGEGIRVFFVKLPVATEGSGVVEVANPDGSDTFIESETPYFRYDQALSPGKVSLPSNWQFNVPTTVTEFTFSVAVAARAADEEGIEPGLHFATRTISAGGTHSCGLTLEGDAYCWGHNNFGQLGNGGSSYMTTPVRVEADPDMKFVAIDAGDYHTCAIATTGDAYCWGMNDNGQLGNGENADKKTPTPVEADPGTKFVAISAGYRHTCGITTTGDAYCWGWNNYGQLGNGGSVPVYTPVQVAADAGTKFVAIGAGTFHTCAVATTGDAYCWGSGTSGLLGNGGTDSQNTPSPVSNISNFALLDPLIPAAGAGRLLPARTLFESYALAGRADSDLATGAAPAPCTAGHA